MSEQEKPTPPASGIVSEDVAQAAATIKEAQDMRGTDGDLTFSDILTSFIYVLLKDHLTAGQVEKAIQSVLSGEMVVFTDSFLAQYADSLSNTLKNAKVSALASALEKVFTEKTPEPRPEGRGKRRDGYVRFGDDDKAMAELQEKVEEAIENMSEEDEKVWKEREKDALEEASRNDDAGLRVVPSEEDATEVEREAVERVRKAEWREPPKEEQVEEEKVEGDTEYPDQIASSLAALEHLKELVPTDTIKQVADILKQEVENELVGDEEPEMTREEILLQQAAIMQEHKATNPEAAKMAEEFMKKQLLQDEPVKEEEDGQPASRGSLKDVRQGKAFPEALDNMFDDPAPAMNKAVAEEAQKKIVEVEVEENKKRTGVFQRVE